MTSTNEIVACVLVACGLILSIVTVADPVWQKTDPESAQMSELTYRYIGLWTDCQLNVGGQWICNDFDGFFLGIDLHIQAGRGFGITACILGTFSFVFMLGSISVLQCSNTDEQKRNRQRIISGIISGLSGVCMLFAIGWYAKYTNDQYYLPASGNTEKMVLGQAIFIGISASILLLISCLLAISISCKRTESNDRYYRPSTNLVPNKEYV